MAQGTYEKHPIGNRIDNHSTHHSTATKNEHSPPKSNSTSIVINQRAFVSSVNVLECCVVLFDEDVKDQEIIEEDMHEVLCFWCF